MKKLFYTKNKSFYGSKEVELENIKPITETPLEIRRKLKRLKQLEKIVKKFDSCR